MTKYQRNARRWYQVELFHEDRSYTYAVSTYTSAPVLALERALDRARQFADWPDYSGTVCMITQVYLIHSWDERKGVHYAEAVA